MHGYIWSYLNAIIQWESGSPTKYFYYHAGDSMLPSFKSSRTSIFLGRKYLNTDSNKPDTRQYIIEVLLPIEIVNVTEIWNKSEIIVTNY